MASEQSDDFYLVSIDELADLEDAYPRSMGYQNVNVDRKADAIRAPVEEGYYVFDNKVIQPVSVDMTLIVKCSIWNEVHEKLVRMFEMREYTFYEITTRGDVFGNMALIGMSRAETNEMYDAMEVKLNFLQILTAREERKKVRKPTNRTTMKCGFHFINA